MRDQNSPKLKGSIIIILLFSLSWLTSCYDPDDFKSEPKEYLPAEVKVRFNNEDWNLNDASFSLGFASNRIGFSAIHDDRQRVISCFIEINGRSEGKNICLFKPFSDKKYEEAIVLRSYKTSDTLWVGFFYQESTDNLDITQSKKRNSWDDADPDYCVFTVESVKRYEDELYLSGNFSARVYRSYDNTLTPAYHFYSGTFVDVPVTQIDP